jgi:hypothetical protein
VVEYFCNLYRLNVANGVYQAQLKSNAGVAANTIQFTVLTAKLIPVTFTVNNATSTNTGDYIFLTGSTVELGQWGTTFDTAIGPLLDPNYPNWFLNVSVPAGQTIQFKFVKIAATVPLPMRTAATTPTRYQPAVSERSM